MKSCSVTTLLSTGIVHEAVLFRQCKDGCTKVFRVTESPGGMLKACRVNSSNFLMRRESFSFPCAEYGDEDSISQGHNILIMAACGDELGSTYILLCMSDPD